MIQTTAMQANHTYYRVPSHTPYLKEIRPPIILARLTRTRDRTISRIKVFHVLVPSHRERLQPGLFYDYTRLLIMPTDGFGAFLDAGHEDVTAAELVGMIQDR
jgi:hypothetical protein